MVFWVVAIFIILLDRVSKYFIMQNMIPGQSIPVIKNFFHITFIENSGAAFGILKNQRWVFVLVTVVVLFFVIYLVYTEARQKKGMAAILGLVAGGGVGNLIDRIKSGYVTDFLDFRGIWSYVFNIADSALVVGVIMLSVLLIIEENRSKKAGKLNG